MPACVSFPTFDVGGIGAFLFGLIPVFGALVGIVAVVLGILALRKQQSKGLSLTGIILGGIAILASIAMTFGSVALLNSAAEVAPATVIESAAETAETAESPGTSPSGEVPVISGSAGSGRCLGAPGRAVLRRSGRTRYRRTAKKVGGRGVECTVSRPTKWGSS